MSSATPHRDHVVDRFTAEPGTENAAITIRPGYADDASAVAQLAALDSAPCAPAPPLLVVEVEGELRVVLSLRDGAVVADPFFPTLHLIALLRAHAAGVGSRRGHSGRRWRLWQSMPSPRAQASGA
jgi:hypothetical protein